MEALALHREVEALATRVQPRAAAGETAPLAEDAVNGGEADQVGRLGDFAAADAGPRHAWIVSPSTFSRAWCDGMPQ